MEEESETKKIVNMCPHVIKLWWDTRIEGVNFEPSGRVCRCVFDEKEAKKWTIVYEDNDVTDFGWRWGRFSSAPGVNELPVEWAPRFSHIDGLPLDLNPVPDIIVTVPVGNVIRDNKGLYAGAVYGPRLQEGVVVPEKTKTVITDRLVVYKERTIGLAS